MNNKLTPKQAMFISEYLIDRNSTRAAIAAGFSVASASVTGARLRKKAAIAAAIAERTAKSEAKCEVVAEELDRELLRVARADIGRFYDENGRRIPVHLLDEDTRLAINSVEDETVGGVRKQKVKLGDKIRAIELLYKRKGLLAAEKVNHRFSLEDLVTGGDGQGEAGSGEQAA